MFLQAMGRVSCVNLYDTYLCHPPPVLNEHYILIAKGMYHTGLHMPPSPCPEGTFYPYSKGYVPYRFTHASCVNLYDTYLYYQDRMFLQDRDRVACVNMHGTYPLLSG
jgi:hypothetical protein